MSVYWSKLLLLFLVAPNLGSFPVSVQIQARQKPVPQAAPKKSEHRVYNPLLSFLPQGEAGSCGYLLMMCCGAEGDIMARGYHKCSYQLQYS